MSDRLHTPWSEAQIAALNAFQRSGVMHPFTCGNDQHRMRPTLIAEQDGWRCPDESCDYRQTWAHAFMALPVPRFPGVMEQLATLQAITQPGLAAALRQKEQQLRETETQLGQERRRTADLTQQLTAALLRIQALQVHEAIVRIPAQPPDPDGLCGEYLYAKPINDVPTGGVL